MASSSSRSRAYKRNRNVLSIEMKTEIIKRLGKGETVSSLARIFSVGKATVSDIKSNKDKIMSFALKFDSENGSKKRKTMRNAKDLKLEEALYIWFVQRRSKGEPISGSLLCEKALQFNNQLDGSPDFKASQGWLRNFKSRHGIQEWEIQVQGRDTVDMLTSVLLNKTTMEPHAALGFHRSQDSRPCVGRSRKLPESTDIRQSDMAPEARSVGVMKMVYNTDCNSLTVLTSDSYTGLASVDSLDSLVGDQRSSQVSQSQTGGTAQHDSQSQTGGTTQDDVAPHETCSSSEKSTRLCALNTHDQKIETETVPCQVDGCGEEVADVKPVKQIRHIEDKPYVCTICFVSYSHTSQLEKHTKTHSRDKEKPFTCDICGLRVTRLKGLRMHKRIHTGEKPYKCVICSKRFIQSSDLSKHFRIHTGEKPYKCDVCSKLFTHSSDLNKHLRIHTGEKPYKCDVCSKGFIQSSDLNKHFRIHTGEKPYKCHICAAGFAWVKDFNKHTKTHLGEKTHTCDVCGISFTFVKCLKRHQRIHTGEKPFQCNVCQVAFDEECDLKEHVLVHLGEKPFRCDFCDAAFRQVEHLARHLRIHSGERPYKCDVCGGDFVWAESLKRHQRIHTVEKPFKCHFCCSSFNQGGDLKKHQRRMHANTCQGGDLKKHQRRMHANTCDSLGAGLELGGHVDRLNGTHASNHKCDDCNVGFTQFDHLKNHLHIHIGD